MKLSKPLSVILSVTSLCLSMVSQAHTPYLAPTSFEPVMGGMVTLDASFAEAFFVPEAAFNDSEFQVTTPSGKNVAPDTIAPLKTRVVVEHKLAEKGTYRITTGSRSGAIFLIYDVDGEEKRAMNPTKPLPEGAKVKMHFRSVTRADTYVTHKKINNAALLVEDTGLQLLPVTHPNNLYAGEKISIKVVFEGKPLADTVLMAYPANGETEPKALEFKSNKDGVVALELPAGKHLLRARHRAPAPEGSEVPTLSHTTTLSVNVFENL